MSNLIRHMIPVSGVECAACSIPIINALKEIEGVQEDCIWVSKITQSVLVITEDFVTRQQIIEVLEAIGTLVKNEEFSVQDEQSEQNKLTWKTIVAALVGLPLLISSMFYEFIPALTSPQGQFIWLGIALVTASMQAYSGKDIYLGAWQSSKVNNYTMNTLIAISTLAAFALSIIAIVLLQAQFLYLDSAAMVLTIVNLGKLIESHATKFASKILELQPKQVSLIYEQKTIKVWFNKLEVRDRIRIEKGEQIPVDGKIVVGNALIDQSAITGESLPIEKTPGDSIQAGTMNIGEAIEVEATAVGDKTTLSKIISLVREAQTKKTKEFSDTIAWLTNIFVPAVLFIALITFSAWYYYGGLATAITSALNVLVIACPCALGLAIPMAIGVTMARAQRKGILIRDGDALLNANNIKTIVFDKTGTLTEGKPVVQKTICAEGFSETDLKKIAAELEKGNSHPIARAFTDEVGQKDNEVKAVGSQGVSREINGEHYLLGNRRFMEGIDLSSVEEEVLELTEIGRTPVFLAQNNKLIGLFAIADKIRHDAADTIAKLKEDMNVIMLTGDNEKTAEFVASKVKIKKVYAGVLPEEKVKIIKELKLKGTVVMVGDGTNDAGALEEADVGIAMKSSTSFAYETASVILLNDSLDSIPSIFLPLANDAQNTIYQNLFLTSFYNIFAMPSAAGLFSFKLNPTIASAMMSLSSLSVVFNSMRPRFNDFIGSNPVQSVMSGIATILGREPSRDEIPRVDSTNRAEATPTEGLETSTGYGYQ